jgi:hypothetical protein
VRIDCYRFSVLLLVGALCGCAHPSKIDQNSGALSNTPAKPAVSATTPDAAPRIKHPRVGPAVASAARPQIDQLIGLDEAGIKTALGAPAAEEDHAPTKRWIYHVRQCTMDVTFYPEVETRQFHALNYEVNSDDGSAKRQQACVAEFTSRLPAKPLAK